MRADRFRRRNSRAGSDSVAFYVSGQFLTEGTIKRLTSCAKGLIGPISMPTPIRGYGDVLGARVYKATLARGRPAPCYEDIDFAQCMR